MRKKKLYKKWNFLVLLNNLIMTGSFMYTKKIIFLRYDISKYTFWVYSKKMKFQNTRIINLKKRFKWV